MGNWLPGGHSGSRRPKTGQQYFCRKDKVFLHLIFMIQLAGTRYEDSYRPKRYYQEAYFYDEIY